MSMDGLGVGGSRAGALAWGPLTLCLVAACSDGGNTQVDPAATGGDGMTSAMASPTQGVAGSPAAMPPAGAARDDSDAMAGAAAPAPATADGNGAPQQPADPAAASGDGAPGAPTTPERLLTESIVVPAIPPGSEATVCMTKRLSNAVAEQVVEVRAHISPGSHHFIVDRAPSDFQIAELTPCPGLAGTDQSRILIAEKPDTTFSMPPGVVFGLRPMQNLTLELHYINYTEEPLDVQGRIELVLTPEGSEGQYQEAGMIFTGTTAIGLLPGQQSTVEFFGMPAATPQAPVHVFAMTSHTHSLGVRSWIERVPNALDPGGELLHESLDWAQPPMDQYDPPLTFTGADGVRLRCQFDNDTDRFVTFGTRFNDEMCFMWLYYYPNTGAFF